MTLKNGESHMIPTTGIEVALVPLRGSALITVGEQAFRISRSSVWEEMPHVLYGPARRTDPRARRAGI